MKKNIFKIAVISVLIYILFQTIYFFWLVFMFFHGAGSGTEGAIEDYYFKMDSVSFHKEWRRLSVKEIEINDSIWKREDSFDKYVLFIDIKKSNHFKMYYYHTIKDKKEPLTVIHLVRINNKTNDDFGWFSWEKHKELKLFEESFIEPLSQKYERIESP